MIIVDFSQITVADYAAAMRSAMVEQEDEIAIDEGGFRHMVLNSIRSVRTKFKEEFGEVVLACDDKHSWRKDYYPYYKANRKKARSKSMINWDKLYPLIDTVREECKAYFPYPTVRVNGAEGDDVIGTLVRKVSETEKVLIYSRDKDFIQLHNDNVQQYDSINDRFITHPNPDEFLLEQFLRGDKNDGVPNYLMGDDTFVKDIRQRPITEKLIKNALTNSIEEFCASPEEVSNFKRNMLMIDLSRTPKDIQANIIAEWESQKGKARKDLLKYFMEKKLSNLIGKIQDF